MAAVSLAMPTKLWDPAGRECGRTFLYLHFCSYGKRPSLEPHCGILLHGCRNLVFIFCSQHDDPIHFLESGFDYVWHYWKPYTVFEKYYQGIYFRSNCLGWFACYRTQFLTDLFKDPFLSSVCACCQSLPHSWLAITNSRSFLGFMSIPVGVLLPSLFIGLARLCSSLALVVLNPVWHITLITTGWLSVVCKIV